MTDANVELVKLREQRSRAASCVSDLERDWRAAVEASKVASAELVQVERRGGSAASRRAAEEKLAAAKERAAEPFAERLEGARAAARDADRRYRAFVAAHLGVLLDEIEEDGRAAAQAVDAAASNLIAAFPEREQVARSITSLLALVGRPMAPGDVSYSRAEEAAKAAIALVNLGGEEPPTLDRSRMPWAALLAEDEVVEVVDDVSVPA